MDRISHRISAALGALFTARTAPAPRRPAVAIARDVLQIHGEGHPAWSAEGQVGRWRLRTARERREGEAIASARRLVVAGPGFAGISLTVSRDAVEAGGLLRTHDADFDRHTVLNAPPQGGPRLIAALGPALRTELRALARLGTLQVADGRVVLHREHRPGADDSVRIACIHLGRLVRVATRLAAALADAPGRLAARVCDEPTPALRLAALDALAAGWPATATLHAARAAAARDPSPLVRRAAPMDRPIEALSLTQVLRRPGRPRRKRPVSRPLCAVR